MTKVLSFDDAMQSVSGLSKRHLLLGNGFSISLKPDIFSYGALFDSADFNSKPHIKDLFKNLKTQDFEIVIKHLQDAATVLDAYGRTDGKLPTQL
ncbi:hypothetical protein ABH999_003163 [Bradyrhizobium yuanmingense]|uniref:DUF4917 family protein n=1 Tax=Bradyrhizobium yuanmingense TaxID=108015 RepID=UPI003519599A